MSASMTWWGSAGVELTIGGETLLIDPYMQPLDADASFVCITHDHYDHFHPPTLRRIVAGPSFERILVPRSVAEYPSIDSPIDEQSTAGGLDFTPAAQLTAMYPKYTREPGRRHPGPTEIDLGGFHVETVDSSERPWRYKPEGGGPWPAGSGRFVGAGEYPNLGYLITHRNAGVTVYHPGDLGEIFDSHRELRGRVDYMLFPLAKLEGFELTMAETVAPRHIVPLHYRVDTPDFPIPLHVSQDELATTNIGKGGPGPGADPDAYRADLQRKIRGHWFPTPIPPLDRIRSLAGALRERSAELLILDAGHRHELG
jgi:L-ascorbate metabolism protein UlaG (beta-lactamase superfamily)